MCSTVVGVFPQYFWDILGRLPSTPTTWGLVLEFVYYQVILMCCPDLSFSLSLSLSPSSNNSTLRMRLENLEFPSGIMIINSKPASQPSSMTRSKLHFMLWPSWDRAFDLCLFAWIKQVPFSKNIQEEFSIMANLLKVARNRTAISNIRFGVLTSLDALMALLIRNGF